jgi:thymidylate kinase
MPGQLIVHLIQVLEVAGIASVYLRNYENLPGDVGNDVDLLIPHDRRKCVVDIFKMEAERSGWRFIGSATYGERAMYLCNPLNSEMLHVDIYDRFRWRGMDYADAAGVMARRQWNGQVFIPGQQDRLYLNICERLIYHGKIRDKQQLQARSTLSAMGHDFVTDGFELHLGKYGIELAGELMRQDWNGNPALRKLIRVSALLHYGLRRPWFLLTSILAYGLRIAGRMVSPPGRFLVFEGADGVGKSTVMEAVVPWCSSWCAGRAPYDFHWKPSKLQTGSRATSPSVDPRGKCTRGFLVSFGYLLYHIAGFWWGWLVRIYPLLVRSHVVVGDRYSYDIFLDPERFRLGLPSWLCKLAALVVPRPDLVIGLVASPGLVQARKRELSVEAIADYQARWQDLAMGRRWMLTVSADGPVDQVQNLVKCAIMVAIADHA